MMQKMLAVAVILLFATLPQVFASEAVTMAGLEILDENGGPVQNVKLGDSVLIQSRLEVNNQTEQAFVYIVQVQDSAGYTVFLAWTSGTLQVNPTPIISWQPEKIDSYVVQAFLWTSVDAPAPLSFTVHKSTIDVNNCSGSALCFTGTVTKVTDGDTLRVDDIAMRLSLVNTPERGDAGYSEATAFTAEICPVGSSALVDEDDGQTGGSYGRIVAKVYCGGKMLNEELLLAGHAEVLTQYCDESEFSNEGWVARYC
jgi:endonuclease YncB( thermonuclease family)